jgi:hypothetical protein
MGMGIGKQGSIQLRGGRTGAEETELLLKWRLYKVK